MKLKPGILAMMLSATAFASDLATDGREILASKQNSIISLVALSKIKAAGDPQEVTSNGVVIDESGLTVVSYSELNDINTLLQSLVLEESDVEAGDDGEPKLDLEILRIQMHLADGTEVPARLVLQDKEMDLAFLVPEPKEGDKLPKFTPVKLAADTSAKELDDVVVIGRCFKGLGYQPSVTIGHVTTVATKPRTMYGLSTQPGSGSAAFLANGRFLGVTITISGEGSGVMAMMDQDEMGSLEEEKQMLLPASDILALAEQARKAVATKTEK